MATLDCYGDTIEALADMSGGFDLASADSYRSWSLREWGRVAHRIGFAKDFQRAMVGVNAGMGSITTAPLNAFGRWAASRADELAVAGPWNSKLVARIRAESILAFKNQPTIFDAAIASWDLPGGACAGRYPVFLSTAAPSYFRDQNGITLRSVSCEWRANVRIAFGLFPWYAGSLAPAAEGLSWTRADQHNPARDAMRLCVSFFTNPVSNAREDARRVMEMYDRFLVRTRDVIESLPESSTRPGAVYRKGRRLAVYMGGGKEAYAVVLGPRGPIGVHAYNYALERFAAFFSLRRQLMLQFASAPTSVQDALRANADPCLGAYVTPKPVPKAVLSGFKVG